VTEPVQPTHYDLALQISELKGGLNTIAKLIEERNKYHNALEEDHKKLYDSVQKLKERQYALAILGALLVLFTPLIWGSVEKRLDGPNSVHSQIWGKSQ
jgi:hypothetical protein